MTGLEVETFPIAGLLAVTPPLWSDKRGFFCESFHVKKFSEIGIEGPFVQDNHSMSIDKWVVRGLHFQIAPIPQQKLIRVLRGEILDVVVDIRKRSPTFGQHISIVLSAKNRKQLWVPKGFAHGFCTLSQETEVLYKVSDYYSLEYERGLAWDDPDLGISWPVSSQNVIVSDKDKNHPRLKELPQYFS